MNEENRQHVRMLLDGVTGNLAEGRTFPEVAAGLARGLAMLLGTLQPVARPDAIDAKLADLPDPTAEQLEALGGLAAVLPAAVMDLLREHVGASLEQLPSGKTGPKMISGLEKIAVCQQVTALIHSGCSMGVATARVAQRTGRSVQSIRRIYSERGSLQAAFTIDEVKSALLSSFLTGSFPPALLARFSQANESGGR